MLGIEGHAPRLGRKEKKKGPTDAVEELELVDAGEGGGWLMMRMWRMLQETDAANESCCARGHEPPEPTWEGEL